MKISKRLAAHVNFANFAINYSVSPFKLAELCQLCKNRFALAVKIANGIRDAAESKAADRRDDNLLKQITALGKELKFDIQFNGAYPSITRDGSSVHLPIED